jgi:hypothetical protein
MKIYLDQDTNTFVSDPNFKANLTGITLKRGDAAAISFEFVSGNTTLSASPTRLLQFGVKQNGDYDGDFIIFNDTFTIVGTEYRMPVDTNTLAISALLPGDTASVTLWCEATWSDDAGSTWSSSNSIAMTINNDIIKGNEGISLSAWSSPALWLETSNPNYLAIGTTPGYLKTENGSYGFTNYKDTLPANKNIFIGDDAGKGAVNVYNCNYLGYRAGYNATDAAYSNFLGYQAGKDATNATGSNFLGENAGLSAINAGGSNFIGYEAGKGATEAAFSNFIGHTAGVKMKTGTNNNFIGYNSGKNFVTGSKNVCIGTDAGTSNATLSGLQHCIILGDSANATASNQLVLGSTTSPLSVIAGGSLTTSLSGLKVNINGVIYTIPLLA